MITVKKYQIIAITESLVSKAFCEGSMLYTYIVQHGKFCFADLLQLFFDLLRCQDKSLRKFLKDHIVMDLKNVNAKHKDVRLNTVLQNFMFTMLKVRKRRDNFLVLLATQPLSQVA